MNTHQQGDLALIAAWRHRLVAQPGGDRRYTNEESKWSQQSGGQRQRMLRATHHDDRAENREHRHCQSGQRRESDQRRRKQYRGLISLTQSHELPESIGTPKCGR